VRPSNKTWSLTVRRGSLHLDAPHGSFEVLRVEPEVMPVVEALPDGTEVECEGSFDGGGTITHLVVTKVRRILKDMSGRVMKLPDAIVAADGRLAAARARKHFAAGRIAQAAIDVGSLLRLGDDQAIGEFEQLPPEHQAPLLESLVEWIRGRAASWRAMRFVPVERWTDEHVDQAVELGLANGGVFGAAPGIRVEDLLAELERREKPTRTRAKQTQKLRRAQATEGDTFHRITPEVDTPRVVGADLTGVYVAGTAKFGESIVQTGAHRRLDEDRRPVVVLYALDGSEVRRWVGIPADRIVEGVALQLEIDEPAAVRLSDGKVMFTFAHRIEHHDGELAWGVHARDYARRKMRSEIRHIATGFSIATFPEWVDDVTWNATKIFVTGESPKTLTREGRVLAEPPPPPPTTIEIESANGRHAIPASHAPWQFGSWHSIDAGGWIVHGRGKQLYIAPSEPGASWVHLELAKDPPAVNLAPPWLAIHSTEGGPIILLALAEACAAQEIRIDGKRFAKRGKTEGQLAVLPSALELHAALVAAGIMPARSDVERDAHLYRIFEGAKKLPTDALARVVIDHSPLCIDHSDYFVVEEDNLFERLTQVLAPEGVAIREVARHEREGDDDIGDDDDDENNDVTLTITATRDGKTLKRQCGWGITNVMGVVDAMLAQLGSPRRLFALTHHDYNRRPFLAITADQRRALVAAGIEGIHAGPRG
jgi:hypothetical protein